MLLKNLFRIIKAYRFAIILISLYEFIYLFKGHKGNKFNFSNNELMTDNIPCPYYFLHKIKKKLTNYNFNNFVDFGCGSGRVIDFFNKVFPNKNYIGIEFFESQYKYCKKIFSKNNNIKILLNDFTKENFVMHNSDCYFFNDPFVKESDFILFVKKVIQASSKKQVLFIFVNYSKNTIDNLKNLKIIESYYVANKKGYIICILD